MHTHTEHHLFFISLTLNRITVFFSLMKPSHIPHSFHLLSVSVPVSVSLIHTHTHKTMQEKCLWLYLYYSSIQTDLS